MSKRYVAGILHPTETEPKELYKRLSNAEQGNLALIKTKQGKEVVAVFIDGNEPKGFLNAGSNSDLVGFINPTKRSSNKEILDAYASGKISIDLSEIDGKEVIRVLTPETSRIEEPVEEDDIPF